MLVRRFLVPLKRKHPGGLLLLAFLSIICVAFSLTGNDDYDFARREILLRRVGHEILLQSGDSVSRVLPVKKIGGNEYQISFEHAFTFQPESLVNTTQRLLARDPLASDYVVNVLNCANAGVAYGFAISGNKKDDIVTCKGRRQPVACYRINIKFKPAGIITAKNGYLLGSLTVLAFVGFIFLRPVKPRKAIPDRQPEGILTLGSMWFDVEARKLMTDGKTTDLTKTETRVLHIFALSPNEAIERSRLQKEIWEDEGVIVGRSLDMFISKLRKKLEADPNVKIVVIRGKGYKLEIST
ncbi:winged helix-turn-helix domain-containing protein [Flavihumibacter petaseus]|uniref:Putative two-component response regulator n=1 Tax=Flavihumibacter petaseus NBRC 106054 TaxID=1220578 RepID=A0A0E9N3S4_9BACT|nr:winged helix-turn-helix domain-containing protein [Flavihumibacter petaseus]GAO44632.1 putative two-component response regulator [Flavihumibacter petaseus NBRC 106054]